MEPRGVKERKISAEVRKGWFCGCLSVNGGFYFYINVEIKKNTDHSLEAVPFLERHGEA